MSYITENRAIVPTLWPNNLGRVGPRLRDMQVRDDWRFVPEDGDALYDWATVIDDDRNSTDGRLVKHLVYDRSVTAGANVDTNYEVTVVVQGFLGDHAIGPLGNWRGDERDAPSAVQFVTLESGGAAVAFDAQQRALQDILDLIHTQVGGEPRNVEDANKIVLRRPVFDKVRPTTKRVPSVVELTNVNDPFGTARKIATRWRIDHVIGTLIRRPNGADVPVASEAIRKGDFVEVTVTAHIRTLVSRKRREVVVDFAMHEVVRLWSAREAKKLYVRTDNLDNEDSRGSRITTLMSVDRLRERGSIEGITSEATVNEEMRE